MSQLFYCIWVLLATITEYKNKSGLNNEENVLFSLDINFQSTQLLGWLSGSTTCSIQTFAIIPLLLCYIVFLQDGPEVPGAPTDITTHVMVLSLMRLFLLGRKIILRSIPPKLFLRFHWSELYHTSMPQATATQLFHSITQIKK